MPHYPLKIQKSRFCRSRRHTPAIGMPIFLDKRQTRVFSWGMYVASVPNRNSLHAILLRERFREYIESYIYAPANPAGLSRGQLESFRAIAKTHAVAIKAAALALSAIQAAMSSATSAIFTVTLSKPLPVPKKQLDSCLRHSAGDVRSVTMSKRCGLVPHLNDHQQSARRRGLQPAAHFSAPDATDGAHRRGRQTSWTEDGDCDVQGRSQCVFWPTEEAVRVMSLKTLEFSP